MLRKMLNIEENTVAVNNSTTDYVAFGKGRTPLLIIPGLSDGLKTVKGTGLMLRFIYRFLAGDFKVYVFSRKNELKPGYTTREMAADLAQAMDQLDLVPANVMGISQGGMIAQWLAIDYPEKIIKLAIVISVSRQNDTTRRVIGNWVTLAGDERYDELAVDMMEKSHTEKYLQRVRPFYWLIKKMSRPKSQQRFLIQAESCLTHDAYADLSKINCPTFIIGGGVDHIVGSAEVQQDLADAIKNSTLYIYPDLGHGAYAEAKDFGERIYKYFSNQQ